eukprot:188003_1
MRLLSYKPIHALLLFQTILFISITLVILHPYDIYNTQSNYTLITIQNESKIMDNKTNCSNLWRHQKQYQINLNDLFGDSIPRKYTFKTVPKGTFNYWLSHIESQNRISDKSFFADKFLMKQYIINYTKIYPLFNRIHHTKILWDFSKDGNPSFNQLWNLKKKNQSFLVKPNHTSHKQIIVNPNEYFSRQLYHRIMKQSRKWFVNEHKKNVGRTKREPWYKLINPRIFIEENINVDPVNYPLTEYNLHVFNHKALFIFVYKHNEMMNVKNLNFYTIPDFKWLNATWWPKKKK